MYPDIRLFEVFEKEGMFGLRLVNSKWVVLPPKYKRIYIGPVSFLITEDDKKLTILIETYGDDMICLRDLIDGHNVFYFVDNYGHNVLTIDQKWEEAHRRHVLDVLTSFMCGVVTLELDGSNEYYSMRAIVNKDGGIMSEYCFDLKEEVLNPLDYLNYDGYGMPEGWLSDEDLY